MKIIILLFSNILIISASAQSRNIFFDYQQDSLRATRSVNLSAPSNAQSFAINSSIVTDYIGNARVALLTGIITSKRIPY